MPWRVAQINIASPWIPKFLPRLRVRRAGCSTDPKGGWSSPLCFRHSILVWGVANRVSSPSLCMKPYPQNAIPRQPAILNLFFAEHCVEPGGLNRAVACPLDLYNHVCQILADIKMLSTRVNTAPFIEKCHFRFSPTCEQACRERFIIMAGLQWASPPKQSRQMRGLYLHLLEGFHGVSLD